VREKYVEEVSALRDAAEVDVKDPALKEFIDGIEKQREGAASGNGDAAEPAKSE
jgi:peptidyl-prolyl cis-trans isomerase C